MAGRGAYRDQMQITDRLDLRHKAEQIGEHERTVTDDERRIAELPDQHRMMQVTAIAAVPELA
jgi:hypothetical protein